MAATARKGAALAIALVLGACAAADPPPDTAWAVSVGASSAETSGTTTGSDSLEPEPPGDDTQSPTVPPEPDDGSSGLAPDESEEGDASTAGSSSSGEPTPIDGSSSTGDPQGAPMYAPCITDDECGDGTCLGVYEVDVFVSGFCTGPCANPIEDCDPAPAGDASPACITATSNYSWCSLDCANGATCPPQMACTQFVDFWRCVTI